jgi:pilus assembly protein Flp/PilA
MINLVKRFATDESGATAIEYGLIAAGISVAIITVVNTLGSQLKTTFTKFPRSSPPPASKRPRRGERLGRAARVLA